MREIKFRGKRKDNGEWVYGYFVEAKEYTRVCYIMTAHTEGGCKVPIIKQFKVIPESVGQFTGLHDKNGKEIYEGDIVIIPNATQPMAVQFQPPNFIMRAKTKGGKWSKRWSEFIIYWKNPQLQEVIGNIHDNPELLEKHK